MNTVLVTGGAGFIGSSLVDRLLKERYKVICVDNFNDYYAPILKERNLEFAKSSGNFKLYKEDILNYKKLRNIFANNKIDNVVHLAARAGVRQSLENPSLYARVNVLGTVNLLNLCSEFNVSRFIFGSSSSVYGESEQVPFKEDNLCGKIVSPYGSSKRSAEFFVESFHGTFGIRSTILRFFTVYGPKGRPDMAPALFMQSILFGKAINQFGDGKTYRDYTYIDDIVDGILKALAIQRDFAIVNLGNNVPVKLSDFIQIIEKLTGKKAKINKMPNQKADVEKTWADITEAKELLNWQPTTDIVSGLTIYFRWLKSNPIYFQK